MSPLSRRRSKESAADFRHPSPARGLPVPVLDVTQGEKQSVLGQGSQHGDGLFSPAQHGRHAAREGPVSASPRGALPRRSGNTTCDPFICREDPSFRSLEDLLSEALPVLVHKPSLLVLGANFCTLGLMMGRLTPASGENTFSLFYIRLKQII